ncbi:hypothetical protein BLFGPEAP_02824 [Candidatus Methanoperedenaceae archaeon GB50]|nr:hypothetical protein BLFGPEAP_02824 [Candidatus Methanoperedenaceae archaeon GB50]
MRWIWGGIGSTIVKKIKEYFNEDVEIITLFKGGYPWLITKFY